jgi:hypothetical protein
VSVRHWASASARAESVPLDVSEELLDQGSQSSAARLAKIAAVETQTRQRAAAIDTHAQRFEKPRRSLVAQINGVVLGGIVRRLDSQTAQPGQSGQLSHLLGTDRRHRPQSPGDADVCVAQQRLGARAAHAHGGGVGHSAAGQTLRHLFSTD